MAVDDQASCKAALLRVIGAAAEIRRELEAYAASRCRVTQILRVVRLVPDFTAFSRLRRCDFNPILPNLQAQPAKEAHVDVGQPYQRETCDEIASPVIEQQLVTGDEQEEGGDLVTEAVLAREQVEELARVYAPARFAFRSAPVARLSKHFFVRHGPRDGRNRNRENKQKCELTFQAHSFTASECIGSRDVSARMSSRLRDASRSRPFN